MPQGPDFFRFTLQRIFSLAQQNSSGSASPEGQGQGVSSQSESKPVSTSTSRVEGAGVVLPEQSSRVEPFSEDYLCRVFSDLPNALLKLDETTRRSILTIHENTISDAILSLTLPERKGKIWESYSQALARARTEFMVLQLPPDIFAGLIHYYDVWSRLAASYSSIQRFASNAKLDELSQEQDLLPISPTEPVQYGVFALFLYDLNTALQGRQPLSFPEIVRSIPANYLHINEGDERPEFSWDHLVSGLTISRDFAMIVRFLLTMSGYLPTLTRAEQLAFLDLSLAGKGFQPSEEHISTIPDSALQDRIRSIPPLTRKFLAHVSDLYPSFSGYMMSGLCPLVGLHKKQGLHLAIQSLPPDFFTPTSLAISTSEFGPDKRTVVGTDGKLLTLNVRHRGMFYDVNGNFLVHPAVDLSVALKLAKSGGIISWLTWARRAGALERYYNTLLPDALRGYLNIESVYSNKSEIVACYPPHEAWLYYLALNLFAAQGEYLRLNKVLDPWSCIKEVRERIDKGIADVPYALWYIAPFATGPIQEIPFYRDKLRHFLVSSLLLDYPFFEINSHLYFELRKTFFQDNDPYLEAVGGLVLAASLPYLNPIFHPDHGVSYIGADGQPHKHVVTLADLCWAAGVGIYLYQVDGVTYLTLGPSTRDSSQYSGSLRSAISSAIDEWVNGTAKSVQHRLRPSGWQKFSDQPEIYEMVMRFLLRYWYPANRTVEVIPASFEPSDLVSKIHPVVCDPQGSIRVERAPVVAGPVYGQGGPAQLCEDVIDIVTRAPYATVLGNLPPHIRHQIDIILQPRPIMNSDGEVATDPNTKKPIYFVRCPNADYQYPDPVRFGEQSGIVPPGIVRYSNVMSLPPRYIFSIVDALSRGNHACRIIFPGSDEAAVFRSPQPPCDSFVTWLLPIAYNSSELLIREAVRLALERLGKQKLLRADVVKEAEDIWANRFFYNSCFSPADLHRAIVDWKELPSDLRELLLNSWNVTLHVDETLFGRRHRGSLVRYNELLYLLGCEDPDLQEMFKSGSSGRALELGAEVVGDFVPSVGLSPINMILRYVAKSGEKLSNFMARDAYRLGLPVIGSSVMYAGLGPLYPYYPLELLVVGGFIGGSLWCIIPIWKRSNFSTQARLRSLAACASGCAVYDSKQNVREVLQNFRGKIRDVYL